MLLLPIAIPVAVTFAALPFSSKFGSACTSLNEYLDAINSYKKAIAIDDVWNYRFNLGNAYQHAGLYNKAIDEYQKAKELSGDSDSIITDSIIKRIVDCLLLR